LSKSYLNEDFNIGWVKESSFHEDWRFILFNESESICPNKKFIIENLPRSIPSHSVELILDSSFDRALTSKLYLLFYSNLSDHTRDAINDLLGDVTIEIEDLRKSINLFMEFQKKIDSLKRNRTLGRLKKNKYSSRKTRNIIFFTNLIKHSTIIRDYKRIIGTGFCFSSLLDLTASLCVNSVSSQADAYNEIGAYKKTKNKDLVDWRENANKIVESFLKKNPNTVDIHKDLEISSYEPPPF
jgi:hypothetical protein